MTTTEIRLGKWAEIHDYATKRFSGWVFRGHQKASWHLESSIERCCNRHQVPCSDRQRVETLMVREFRRTYHQYAQHVPAPENALEWLALMQHHGAPTRMLDFTYSVYVAAYFATEEAAADDCSICAFDAPWLLTLSQAAFRKAGKDIKAVNGMLKRFEEGSEEVAARLFLRKPFDVGAVYPTNAFRLNERLRIQQGVFLLPGDISRSFEDNFRSMGLDKDHCRKIIIPASLVAEARRHLFVMGISRTSLFPGLDGYAKSLGVYGSAIEPPFEWDKYVADPKMKDAIRGLNRKGVRRK